MTVRQKRSVGAFLFASLLATGVVTIHPMKWSPVCVGLAKDSLEWFLFGCWIDTPPQDPRV